jgi:hypothetical protein
MRTQDAETGLLLVEGRQRLLLRPSKSTSGLAGSLGMLFRVFGVPMQHQIYFIRSRP